jgi:hypothetical protein
VSQSYYSKSFFTLISQKRDQKRTLFDADCCQVLKTLEQIHCINFSKVIFLFNLKLKAIFDDFYAEYHTQLMSSCFFALKYGRGQ